MIFLIFKIFIYLLLAGVVGGAAGWLLRNLQGQRREEEAGRAAADAVSKLTQAQSLLRLRDEQVAKLKSRFAQAGKELKEQARVLASANDELEALRERLSAAQDDARRAAEEFEVEQQKVRDMESELELQQRTLHVLNLQLELERNRRTAAG